MIIGVDMAKKAFLDSKPVMDAYSRAERRWMNRMGSFIRSDANRSMRTDRSKKQRPSRSPRPPKAREQLLKRFNFYVYDAIAQDVIVGPIRLQRSGPAIPGLHEHGGTVPPRRGQRRSSRYPPRPYMRPAMEKNLKRVSELKNSVR